MSEARCSYCGFGVMMVPPVEQDGVVVPAKTEFGECPRCRDQFAMAALTGIMARNDELGSSEMDTAEECYDMADAMLEARKPK